MALQVTDAAGGFLVDEFKQRFLSEPLVVRAQRVREDRGYENAFRFDQEDQLPLLERIINAGIKSALGELRDLMRKEDELRAGLSATTDAIAKAKAELTALLDSLPPHAGAAADAPPPNWGGAGARQ